MSCTCPSRRSWASQSLAHALAEEWPSYFAFLLSFFTILIMWYNHHVLFTHIKRTDAVLPYANGLLLLFITVTPWPTALLAEHMGHPEERVAAHVFGAFYTLMAVAFNLLWRYASYQGRLLGPNADMDEARRITRGYSAGPLGYFAAFLASFFSVPLCLAIALALAVFFVFTGTRIPLAKRRRQTV